MTLLHSFRIARTSSVLWRTRGAGAEQLDLDELEIASPIAEDDALLALNEALDPDTGSAFSNISKPSSRIGSVRTQTSSWQNGSLSDMLMEKATRSHKE